MRWSGYDKEKSWEKQKVMTYEYLEEVATADIAFRAWAPDLEGVFIAAADAVMNVMVEDLSSIRPVVEREIELEETSPEMLLFDFLQEIIYYKDAETLLLRTPAIRIEQKDQNYVLHAKGRGEKLDSERHQTRVDVKAVTLHRFSLKKTDDVWEGFVILDI
jgi:SHS2 domain-containing protein